MMVCTWSHHGWLTCAVSDHIDYTRLIRLDKYPELLDDMGVYLEDDLESILAKYIDGAVRHVDQARDGNQAHGFCDYLSAMEDEALVWKQLNCFSCGKVSTRSMSSFEQGW